MTNLETSTAASEAQEAPPEALLHDLEVIVEFEDIYALLELPFFGATECIYCMIAAAARRNLARPARLDMGPEPYEVLEGEGGQWGQLGWTHYMRMKIGGRKKLVLVKITHDAAIATLDFAERRDDEFYSAVELLGQGSDNVMFTSHDCATWMHDVWTESSDGEVSWRARPYTDVPGLLRICGDRVAEQLRAAREGAKGSTDA